MDTEARYYTWYMTEDATQRVVAYQWWPENGFMSPIVGGRFIFIHRETPDDVWGPPVEIHDGISFYVAQALAEREGFTVEVAEQ